MTETMSIHKGLAELKLLNKRIASKTSTGNFIDVAIGKSPVFGFENDKEFSKSASSDYDSITSLIKRRNAIKSAIVEKNATTKFKVAGKEMTVAEAIERKNLIVYDKELLSNMKRQYNDARREYELKEEVYKEKMNEHLKNTFGENYENKVNAETRDSAIENFNENNEPRLLDPLKLREKIDSFEEEIDKFESEVDLELSTINVKTEIEVEY